MIKKEVKLGEQYGNFTIISTIPVKRKAGYSYKIRCKCGNILYRNVSEILNCTKKFCKDCCAKTGKLSSNWKGYNNIPLSYYNQIKHGAKVRDIPFNITIKEIDKILINQNYKCILSNLPLKISKNASLDRIDSKIGYELDNVQFIHKDINKMKNAFDETYFVTMCSLIAENNDNKLAGDKTEVAKTFACSSKEGCELK